MGLIALGTALFASATGIPQYQEQRKAGRRAERAQKEANQVSRAQAQVENARRRRQAIAQARIAQAQNIAAQSAQVQTSSALSGVQSGISTQLGANIGAQQQRIGSQQRIMDLGQSAASAIRKGQERAGLWDVGANFANMMTMYAGGISGGTPNSMPNQPNRFRAPNANA